MKYERLSGHSPEITVANALRDLANRAHPNSARSFAHQMADDDLRSRAIAHGTVTNVLKGASSAAKLENATLVAEAIARAISGLDLPNRAAEVSKIAAVHAEAFKPLRKWGRNMTRHCASVAFDWASALPEGPRNSFEIIATLALREAGPVPLHTEVFDLEVDVAVQFEILEGARARSLGRSGWEDRRDDGPTWHGLWGPVAFPKDQPTWFLAVQLDAVGSVSVYIRASRPPEYLDVIAESALIAAIDIVRLLGWVGVAGVLVESAKPSPLPRKSSLYEKYVDNGWVTHTDSSLVFSAAKDPSSSVSIARRLIHGLEGGGPAAIEAWDLLDRRLDELRGKGDA